MITFLCAVIAVMVVGGIWVMYSQSTSMRQIVLGAFESSSKMVIQLTEEIRVERENHSRIVSALDSDYKALVESYLRETGKVYVRPPMGAVPPPPSSLSPQRSGGPRSFQFKSASQIIAENEEMAEEKAARNVEIAARDRVAQLDGIPQHHSKVAK